MSDEEYNPYYAYYDTAEDMSKVFDRMCECGHTLGSHANTMNRNWVTDSNYLLVRQCCLCKCKQFKR